MTPVNPADAQYNTVYRYVSGGSAHEHATTPIIFATTYNGAVTVRLEITFAYNADTTLIKANDQINNVQNLQKVNVYNHMTYTLIRKRTYNVPSLEPPPQPGNTEFDILYRRQKCDMNERTKNIDA
jgi:hypothetical protein